jgi:hypothetical protein
MAGRVSEVFVEGKGTFSQGWLHIEHGYLFLAATRKDTAEEGKIIIALKKTLYYIRPKSAVPAFVEILHKMLTKEGNFPTS